MGEKEDLAELQVELNAIARAAMDAMRHMADMPKEQLPHSGHKSNAEAVLSFFRSYRKDMDDAIKRHIKKYPD